MNIQIQSVSMTYPGGKAALREVSLSLGSPCLIGLLGPNGAGKSTLMKLMTAALLPTGGEIRIDGQPLSKAEKALKQRLGYLPQSFGLYDELRVYQFLDYMAALKGISPARAAVERAMGAGNLSDLRKKKIRTLSGRPRQGGLPKWRSTGRWWRSCPSRRTPKWLLKAMTAVKTPSSSGTGRRISLPPAAPTGSASATGRSPGMGKASSACPTGWW